jgi:uncharacterized delta-60 repeat protein
MNRVWKVATLVAAVCVCLGAMTAGAGAKPTGKPAKTKAGAPGELDPSFGRGGKVTEAFPAENAGSTGPKYELPFEFTPGHLQMAQAPGGKVVVAGATKIVRYLADGKLDPSFGQGGVVTVPRPTGSVFVLAGVAVDSQGRVVLAGLTRPLPTNSTPDPVLSSAALMRFDADGTIDTSFGDGGTLITDFGLGAPKAAGGPGGHYYGASVGLRDIVIDSQNRIVVSGGYVTELGECSSYVNSQGFVARLTESGALDPTFGEGGLRPIARIVNFGQLAPRSSGYLALGSGRPVCTGSSGPANMLTGLDEDGNLDPNFGSFGFRTVAFDEAPALAVAPSGKLLLLGRPRRHSIYKRVHKVVKGKKVTVKVRVPVRTQIVQRLLPGGAADPSFGRVGQIEYVDPKAGSFSALTVDGKERIYLVGRIGKRISKSPRNPLHRTQFLVERTLANGSYDRSFGEEGLVATGFGGPSDAFATQVMFDSKGRLLVGGGITSSQLETGGGFAIARYLTGK